MRLLLLADMNAMWLLLLADMNALSNDWNSLSIDTNASSIDFKGEARNEEDACGFVDAVGGEFSGSECRHHNVHTPPTHRC